MKLLDPHYCTQLPQQEPGSCFHSDSLYPALWFILSYLEALFLCHFSVWKAIETFLVQASPKYDPDVWEMHTFCSCLRSTELEMQKMRSTICSWESLGDSVACCGYGPPSLGSSEICFFLRALKYLWLIILLLILFSKCLPLCIGDLLLLSG